MRLHGAFATDNARELSGPERLLLFGDGTIYTDMSGCGAGAAGAQGGKR